MAPPRKTLRLAEIDPDQLALKVVRAALAHVRALHDDLRPLVSSPHESPSPLDVSPNQRAAALGTPLGQRVRRLALWAQRGMEAEIDLPSTSVQGDLAAVLAAAYGYPLGDAAAQIEATVDPNTALGLVLLAAAARCALILGDSLSVKALAVLAGISRRQVDRLVEERVLVPMKGSRPVRIRARDARRWLKSVGVPGVEEG